VHDGTRLHTLEDYVRVGVAAAILGVTTKTLRNWDRSGKVKAKRHPVNGYRIYLRKELDSLLNQPVGSRAQELANRAHPEENIAIPAPAVLTAHLKRR
jgi:MerR family transcriptional regulator, copper efflux regulator